MNHFNKQYQLVKEAREVLFDFCESIGWNNYIQAVENFGQGNIRDTQAHIVNAYIHWIGNFALQKKLPYIAIATINSFQEMRNEYHKIDSLMEEFINRFGKKEDEMITNTLGKHGEITLSVLAVFTHVLTHEFHHKGQMVSMARILGHVPPDTDLIRL
jgi:uncharacterized damage-inducible protein DinB